MALVPLISHWPHNMAHYALLDLNNVVTNVFVGKHEGEDGINWETHYGLIHAQNCRRTSYNTFKGKHTQGGTPFRKNFAGIGYTYDQSRDAFIPPKPFPSWTLNEETCHWVAPVPYPEDTRYPWSWDEAAQIWVIDPDRSMFYVEGYFP